jgi:hypothetical protein
MKQDRKAGLSHSNWTLLKFAQKSFQPDHFWNFVAALALLFWCQAHF